MPALPQPAGAAFAEAGESLVTYLLLNEQRRVDILDVLWIG